MFLKFALRLTQAEPEFRLVPAQDFNNLVYGISYNFFFLLIQKKFLIVWIFVRILGFFYLVFAKSPLLVLFNKCLYTTHWQGSSHNCKLKKNRLTTVTYQRTFTLPTFDSKFRRIFSRKSVPQTFIFMYFVRIRKWFPERDNKIHY